jgi:LEA14-like dessication related protein
VGPARGGAAVLDQGGRFGCWLSGVGRRGPLSLTLLALAGCATMAASLEPPAVRLLALELLDSSLTRQSFRVTLELTNPNSLPVPVRAMNYDVKLLGEAVASGALNSPFTLPAGGSENVKVDVSMDTLATLGNLTRALRGAASAIDYQVNGTLQVDLPFAKPIPVTHSGQVPLMVP